MLRKVTVCVSCVDGFLTYDFINSLRNQDDFEARIIGVNRTYSSKGEILCDKFYKISDPSNEKRYISDVIKIYNREKFDLFFALSDGESYVISKYKNYLKSKKIKFQSQCDQTENNALTFDKKKFFLFCQKNKIPVGQLNFFKNSNQLIIFLRKKKNQKYILKTLKGSGTRNVFLVNSKRKKPQKILESRLCYELNIKDLKKHLKFNANDYVLMPYYNGDIYDVDCIALNGKVREFAIRKRQIKNRFMYYSTGHVTKKNNKIKSLIKKFVKITNLSGACDFDVIKNKKKFILLEASCRFSGSVGVCSKSGINFPAQLVRYLMKMKLKNYNFKINKSFRSFLTLQEIKTKKQNILLHDYIPHYSSQLKY